ncbi:hypothetical protein [Undibacterium pigrum]|uniref:Uncharacterized protein n=1 Tax=Undibacterium pigrum TaxID=401470 RepID=A0A318JVU4_9BURK|nr:hypothetical protein [Undibacterium pigrum]PXX44835.1 hypothetical protein DFR42_10247 [Undibacterium pigrum]
MHLPHLSYAYSVRKLKSQFSRYLTIFLVGLGTNYLFTDAAQACSCLFQEESGFLHGGRLPSNARGVVLILSEDRFLELTSGQENASLRSLAPDLFAISNHEKNEEIKAVIEEFHPKPERNAQIQGQSHFFRIGPAGGFQKGVKYSIKFRNANERSRHWLYPNQVEVTIDENEAHADKAEFWIDKQDFARVRMLSFPQSGSCSRGSYMFVQNVRYQMSDAFRPYLDSMVYFTQKSSLFAEADVAPPGEKDFFPHSYRSNNCSQIRYGSSESVSSKDIVYAHCSALSEHGPTIYLRGYVGLLEADDVLHETPVKEIQFKNTANEACYGVEYLRQSIAKERRELITDITEELASKPLRDGDAQQFIPILFNLSDHDDPAIRQYSVLALSSMLRQLKTVESQQIREVSRLLLVQIKQKQRPTNVILGSALKSFVSYVLEDPHTGKLAGRMNAEFAGWMGKELLSIIASSEHEYLAQNEYIIQTLKILAGHSKELTSSLISYVNLHPERDFLKLIIELAPQDKRVFQILLKKNNSGIYGIETLLENMTLDQRTDTAILFDVAESPVSGKIRGTAISLLIQRNISSPRMLNLLLENMGRMEALTALRAMGVKAKPAVPVFLSFFKTKLDVSKYNLLVDILKDIHADSSDLKDGYLIASQSDDKEVVELASKALAELKSKTK